MKLVISQPMFLPWAGIFEQIKLADIFVHYDDVQLPQGRSFISRVQIKTSSGINWLTAPIDRAKSGHLINETFLIEDVSWRAKHIETLRHSYSKAPFKNHMYELAREIYSFQSNNLSDFNCNATEKITDFLGIKTKFFRSSELNLKSSSSERLLSVCKHFKATEYITGLGAINYLDYSIFERENIKVNYMDYKKTQYQQIHGDFTPFVSIFDVIANLGYEAKNIIISNAVYWKDYLNE